MTFLFLVISLETFLHTVWIKMLEMKKRMLFLSNFSETLQTWYSYQKKALFKSFPLVYFSSVSVKWFKSLKHVIFRKFQKLLTSANYLKNFNFFYYFLKDSKWNFIPAKFHFILNIISDFTEGGGGGGRIDPPSTYRRSKKPNACRVKKLKLDINVKSWICQCSWPLINAFFFLLENKKLWPSLKSE